MVQPNVPTIEGSFEEKASKDREYSLLFDLRVVELFFKIPI